MSLATSRLSSSSLSPVHRRRRERGSGKTMPDRDVLERGEQNGWTERKLSGEGGRAHLPCHGTLGQYANMTRNVLTDTTTTTCRTTCSGGGISSCRSSNSNGTAT
eukprot:2759761-Rhodomonas_salina.1